MLQKIAVALLLRVVARRTPRSSVFQSSQPLNPSTLRPFSVQRATPIEAMSQRRERHAKCLNGETLTKRHLRGQNHLVSLVSKQRMQGRMPQDRSSPCLGVAHTSHLPTLISGSMRRSKRPWFSGRIEELPTPTGRQTRSENGGIPQRGIRRVARRADRRTSRVESWLVT